MISKQNQSPLELLCSFAVESANGQFIRLERSTQEKPVTLVVFRSRISRTEFKLPVLELTYDRVKKLVTVADEVPGVLAVLA